MKLSILIPTHNRPKLFERCLASVLPQLRPDIEVIVNNDSLDITEIAHPNIAYHYRQFENISLIYKFLLEQSRGEYVYYLEDDDYLVKNILQIELTNDLVAGNYYPTSDMNRLVTCSTMFSDAVLSRDEFIQQVDLDELELGQFFFKRSAIADFEFPMDNNIHNDIKLAFHAANNVKTMGKVFYYQTLDGGDNISAPETTSTLNITKSLDFLKDFYK